MRWCSQIKIHRIDFSQQPECKAEEVVTEQQLWNQERNSVLDQEEPEAPQVKEEQEELCISQEGEQLVVKLEADPFMGTLVCEEKQQSEAEPNSEQLLSHNSIGTEIQDEEGSQHVDSRFTKEEEEPKPKKRRLKTGSDSNIAFLKSCARWRSNGFFLNDFATHNIELPKYHSMKYVIPTLNLPRSANVLLERPIPTEPISEPCQGLHLPGCAQMQHVTQTSESGIIRQAVHGGAINYKLGVESRKPCKFKLFSCPEMPLYQNQITCFILSCRDHPCTYNAVDLSKTPELGFRHVSLIVNEYPLSEPEEPLLKIQSAVTFYLGHVCTIQNISGLLVHRIFAATSKLLEDILDMHTRLQVHPFVPRTFTLQLMKVPFEDENTVGVFVGESPGDWNLGNPHGLRDMDQMQCSILAYHVTVCLLRAQILALRVLGFPLTCILPGRIWRHRDSFRLDFVASLVDTIYKWNNDVHSRIKSGVAAIENALRQLTVVGTLPFGFFDRPSTEDVFYDMYTTLTGETVTRDSDLGTILGSNDTYQPFTLDTVSKKSEPFGPFRIQIHNQFFKWNKAVIVEPIRNNPELAQVHSPDTQNSTPVANATSQRRSGNFRQPRSSGVTSQRASTSCRGRVIRAQDSGLMRGPVPTRHPQDSGLIRGPAPTRHPQDSGLIRGPVPTRHPQDSGLIRGPVPTRHEVVPMRHSQESGARVPLVSVIQSLESNATNRQEHIEEPYANTSEPEYIALHHSMDEMLTTEGIFFEL
ncbi:uncharacterized protein KZ484_010351 isoform 2-T2 [Pholidichthys leucotaenia]